MSQFKGRGSSSSAVIDNMETKHSFFEAETKGWLLTKDLIGAEMTKMECAKKLFNNFSTNKVRYHEATDYGNMLDDTESLK